MSAEVASPVLEQAASTGSSVAALWLKVKQDDQPPASIPSTLMPAKHCPQCDHTLNSAYALPEQIVCPQCGWSAQPQEPKVQRTEDGEGDQELLRLLKQAASESLENMKPRKNRG